MENELEEDNQENRRWTAKRKAALVLDIIRGTTTAAQAARTYDLLGFGRYIRYGESTTLQA